MKNRYGGDDEGKWVSCDDREQKLRVWCDDKSEALPVRLVKMDEHGATPNTYFLKNVWEEDEEAQRWVSFNWDGRWLYARYKTKEEACPIELYKPEEERFTQDESEHLEELEAVQQQE